MWKNISNKECFKQYDVEKVVAEFMISMPILPNGKLKIRIIDFAEQFDKSLKRYLGSTNILIIKKYLDLYNGEIWNGLPIGSVEDGETIEEALENTIRGFFERMKECNLESLTDEDIEYDDYCINM